MEKHKQEPDIEALRQRIADLETQLAKCQQKKSTLQTILDKNLHSFLIMADANDKIPAVGTYWSYAFRIEANGQLVQEWTSNAFTRISGFTAEEVDARDGWPNLIHPDDRPIVMQRMQKLGRGLPDVSEYRLVTKDGRIRWIRDYARPVPNSAAEKMVLFYGTAQDITENKRAEEISKRNAENLATAQRIAHLGSWEWNLITEHVYWSDEMFRICGVEPGTFQPTYETAIQYIHPEDRATAIEVARRAIEEGESYNIEKRIVQPDGSYKVVLSQGEVIYDEGGHPRCLAGTFLDITERKQAEEKLRKFSRIVQQVADYVLITDKEGVIEYANPAFEEITGYSTEEAIGQTPAILASGEQDEAFYEQFWKTIRSGEVFRAVFLNRKKDGELFYDEKTVTPFLDEQGNLTHFVATGKDITAQKKLEERLRTISQLGWELALIHDEETIVHRVLTIAASLFPSADACCGLVDEEAGELEYQHLHNDGRMATDKLRLPLDGERGIGVVVVASGEALNVPNTKQDARFVHWPQDRTIRSELCVPMKIGERTIGILNVEGAEPYYFTSVDEQLLQTLADQTAVLLENARLYQAERARRQEIEAVQRASLSLTASLDLSQVLNTIVLTVSDLVSAQNVHIFLYEQNRLVFSAGMEEGVPRRGPLAPPRENGLTYSIARQGKPIIVSNMATSPLFVDASPAWKGSIVGFPLKIGSEVLGVMNVARLKPGPFSRSDMRALQLLADQATIAIENARLYKDLQDQMRMLQQTQAQLVHSEKIAALGRLVASIVHEINNPLQAVQGLLNLVGELNREPSSERVSRYLEVVKVEIERIILIVNRMRDFYRPAPQKLHSVDLHEVLASVLELVAKQLQESNILVEKEWSDELPLLLANEDSLKQVFLNLILNAVDAMPQGGRLYLRTVLDTLPVKPRQPAEAAVRIEFRDTGQGIPPKILDHVFEPFFTTKKQGSGQGLSISYGIIESYGGQMSVKSRVGVGTTFTILLPVNTPAVSEANINRRTHL